MDNEQMFQGFVAICLVVIILLLCIPRKSGMSSELEQGLISSGSNARFMTERADTGSSAFIGDGQNASPNFWNIGDLQAQMYGEEGSHVNQNLAAQRSLAASEKADLIAAQGNANAFAEGFNQYDLFDGAGAPRTNPQQLRARSQLPY